MTRFAQAVHQEFIAAPLDTVRAQFAGLDHHIHHNVHPKLRFEWLERRRDGTHFVQEVKLLGLRQRDVFERRMLPDGGIEDVSVEGFNRSGRLQFRFEPHQAGDREGTPVQIEVQLPLPPLVGWLIRPLLESQIRREMRAAAQEDRLDIEQRGYPKPRVGVTAANATADAHPRTMGMAA